MFLTEQELFELTKYVRRDCQIRALRFMGIEHKARPDGSIAVLKSHVEKEFAGVASNTVKSNESEPNWGAIR